MLKKSTIFLCVLALLVGLYAVTAAADDANVAAYIGPQSYGNVEQALSAANDGDLIKLNKDVVEQITVDKNVYLDLNGNNIGTVNVADGVTLYCLDSANDGYDDTKCGKIVNVTGYGTVAGVEAGMITWEDHPDGSLDSYLMVEEEEENKNLSFHRVNLQITAMTLQNDPQTGVSVYYKSAFRGDKVVKENIKSYGVAMSVQDEPTAADMGLSSKYSEFTPDEKVVDFQGEGSGTTLKGIMKKTNADLTNRVNSKIRVFGRAYIRTAEGYIFGVCKNRTLQEAVIDANSLVKNGYYDNRPDDMNALTAMYDTYRAVMQPWELDSIPAALQEKQVKILGIGNSFTWDSMHLLGEVYKVEGNTKNVTLGYAYHSGCSLKEHYNFINGNEAEYNYHYLDEEDNWVVEEGVTLRYILEQQNWDLVSMQQDSENSGMVASYDATHINRIKNYVKQILGYEPKFMWNMTWSYPDDAPLANDEGKDTKFKTNYSGNIHTMYRMITAAVQQKIDLDEDFAYVIPAGTAIQNARTDVNFKLLYRDTKHLSDLGRVIAAYTWYCQIEGKTLVDTIALDSVTKDLRAEKEDRGEDMSIDEATRQAVAQSVNEAMQNKFESTYIMQKDDPKTDNELNILMVGNSFCYYYTDELYQLLAEAYPEKKVNVCNVYYSGCYLDWHLKWWQNGKSNYKSFASTTSEGRNVVYKEVSLDKCLEYADWDYISLQGTVDGAPNYLDCVDNQPIQDVLYQQIKANAEPLLDYFYKQFPDAQLLWHRTWAFEKGRVSSDGKRTYTEEMLAKYDEGMQTICKRLCDDITDAKDYNLQMVNTGAAWKKAREANAELVTKLIPEEGGLCARLGISGKESFPYFSENANVGDGYHDGDRGGGQFLNACVWYETITGQCCLENNYQPTKDNTSANIDGNYELSDKLAELLKTAACTCENH